MLALVPAESPPQRVVLPRRDNERLGGELSIDVAARALQGGKKHLLAQTEPAFAHESTPPFSTYVWSFSHIARVVITTYRSSAVW